MSKKKTLFISDIHMATGKEWDWFNIQNEGPRLEAFFDYVIMRQEQDGDIEELVLLGDIFDLWVCPHDQEPHTFDDICQAQQSIIKKIIDTAKDVPIHYVNGNHDFRVTEQQIAEAFDGAVRYQKESYRRDNIYAEHGHRRALFNCPDEKNGGFSALPVGYFISRLHTTLGEGQKARSNLISQAIREVFDAAGPVDTLAQSVLDAVKQAAEKTRGITIDRFVMGQFGPDISYEEVRHRYKDLYADWLKKEGFWSTTQMIMCEVNRLGSVADNMCKDGINIVVLGHSHDTKMDKDSFLVENRIYANCGYWCGFQEKEEIDDNAHFVETDGETVTLNRFNRGDIQKVVSRRL